MITEDVAEPGSQEAVCWLPNGGGGFAIDLVSTVGADGEVNVQYMWGIGVQRIPATWVTPIGPVARELLAVRERTP